jgi:hypothetical protein
MSNPMVGPGPFVGSPRQARAQAVSWGLELCDGVPCSMQAGVVILLPSDV